MMASFTPRVRTAGSANSSPIGTVPATPNTRAASNGTLVVATRRPAIKAPTPANAYCASEIWPAYPVTTTIDSKIVATPNVVVTASAQVADRSWVMSTKVTTAAGTTSAGRRRPVPSFGRRSKRKPRIGSARPLITTITTMTKNGTASARPGVVENRVSSLVMTPMSRPAASVAGNDEKPPTSAAASAASTRLVNAVTWRLMTGATRIPAAPASAQPSPQFAVAMRSGDQPSDAAARWFSATAVVARPKLVQR